MAFYRANMSTMLEAIEGAMKSKIRDEANAIVERHQKQMTAELSEYAVALAGQVAIQIQHSLEKPAVDINVILAVDDR